MFTTQSTRGFTLLELLVVILVIAILAAIAVPNFLEAQTRAKVSRVQSDLRAVATGVEMYILDNGRYPAYHYGEFRQHFMGGSIDQGFAVTALPKERRGPTITTPIAYLTQFPPDPFYKQELGKYGDALTDHAQYMYVNWRIAVASGVFTQQAADVQIAISGEWRLSSAGPDGSRHERPGDSYGTPYDPTNGTISLGGVQRYQSDPTGGRETTS
jgi:type II secretion system protein G